MIHTKEGAMTLYNIFTQKIHSSTTYDDRRDLKDSKRTQQKNTGILLWLVRGVTGGVIIRTTSFPAVSLIVVNPTSISPPVVGIRLCSKSSEIDALEYLLTVETVSGRSNRMTG